MAPEDNHQFLARMFMVPASLELAAEQLVAQSLVPVHQDLGIGPQIEALCPQEALARPRAILANQGMRAKLPTWRLRMNSR
jgi:hypothetical protein